MIFRIQVLQVFDDEEQIWAGASIPVFIEEVNAGYTGTYTRREIQPFIQDTCLFTTFESGLFRVIIHPPTGKMAIVPITAWQDFSSNISPSLIELETVSQFSALFSNGGLGLFNAPVRFRHNGLGHILIDSDFTGEDQLGQSLDSLAAQAEYGGSGNQLEAGVAGVLSPNTNTNPNSLEIFPTNIRWENGSLWTVEFEDDQPPPMDYTDVEFGIIGGGISINGVDYSDSETVLLSFPSVSGTTYTWDIGSFSISNNGWFKIREGQDWDGISLNYGQVETLGAESSNFGTDSDMQNWIPTFGVTGMTFNLTLIIDAQTEVFQLVIE